MTREEVLAMLRKELEMEIETTSDYTGSTDGALYKDRHTLRLLLNGDVISEVYL